MVLPAGMLPIICKHSAALDRKTKWKYLFDLQQHQKQVKVLRHMGKYWASSS